MGLRQESLIGKILVFCGLGIVWAVLYVTLFVPLFNKYLISHPLFSNFLAFGINALIIFLGMFLIGFLIDGWLTALIMASGLGLSYIGLSLLDSPMCITPGTGEIFVSSTNATCRMSIDAGLAEIMTKWFHLSYEPNFYYWFYLSFGIILFLAGGVQILLSVKNRDKEIKKGKNRTEE